MGRFFVTLLVGLGVFALAVWVFDLWSFGPTGDENSNKTKKTAAADLGQSLYPRQPFRPEPAPPQSARQVYPLAFAAHFVIPVNPDVASQVDGKLLFIGEALPDGAAALAGVAAFMGEPFHYKEVAQGGGDLVVFYRPLEEEMTVRPHQIIARVDPAKILNEVAIRKAKVKVAEKEEEAAKFLYEESEARFGRAARVRDSTVAGQRVIAEEEYQEKKLGRDKTLSDLGVKKEAVKVAQGEGNGAEIDLKEHTIRNELPFNCKIKTLYRKGDEAVKRLEPVFQLYSVERLRAEGMADVPYRHALKEGMPVLLEPTIEVAPRPLLGHKKEVMALAVTSDPRRPRIVSASEDKTVCIWDPAVQFPLLTLHHPDAVRAVACSPADSPASLLLTGCANGDIYLWDLGKLEGPAGARKQTDAAKKLKGHADGVTALAFGPKAEWFASGGADHRILLWKTGNPDGDPESVYPFDSKHGVTDSPEGTVTSLQFTPQSRLIAASTDNALRIFELFEKGAKLVHKVQHRTGSVAQLGVTQDGRHMIFDQGRRLQILTIPEGTPTAKLENPDNVTPFETLALFSPDGSLLLTGGAHEGRLQLWRAPTRYERGFEVRQLVPSKKSSVTCAAFFPDAGIAKDGPESHAVSGNKDGDLYVWAIPNQDEVNNHQERRVLTMVGGAVDSSTRQIRIGVEVRNPDGRYVPGRPVTIVIEP